MAGNTGNPSSPPSRGDRPAVAPSPGNLAGNPAGKPAANPAGFALLPQGKYLGKPPIALSRPVIVVGSNSNCRVQLRSESVSKVHALLVKSGNTYYIRDLASRTHVYVDDRRVREHALRDGEVLKIGSFLLKFVAPAGAATEPDPGANAAPILPASLVPQGAEVGAEVGGEMPIPVEERGLLIGRRPGSDIPLLEASASSSHAVVFEMDGQHFIRDLGSRTGTFVNGVKVHQHCLNGNDLIRIAETTFRYKPSPETVDDEQAAEGSADAASAGVGLAEQEPTDNLHAGDARSVPPPLSPEVHPSVSHAGDDFGLELLPSNEAPAARDEYETAEQAPSVPPLPVAKISDSAKESSGPILPGRRGWRAIVPEEPPAAVEAPASAEAEDRHVDELDLPLAPDVSSVPDPVAEEPATTSSADDGALDLMKFADEDTSSIPDVDFDESSLVNERSAPADVIDFDLDWEPVPTAEPLLSPDGAAEIAAAEEAEAHRKEDARREAERLEQEQAAAEKAEAERVEAERASAEKAEAERVAAEAAHARQVEAEREAAQRAWAEEAQRVAAEKAEAERLAAEKAEAERAEAERAAAAKAEADRVAAEKAEAERVEAERAAAAKAEAERLEAERLAAESAEAERLEAERAAAAKAEAERLAAEKAEAERIEVERLAAEKAEAERIEAERLAAEKAEAERIEAERLAAEKAEAERVEAERLAAEKAEAERFEAERLAAEKAEADRIAAEKSEADRLAAEKAEAERLEAERVAAERAEAERLEAERIAAEKAEAERLEAERLAAEKAEAERIAAEKAEAERIEAERIAAEKAEADRIEAERIAAEKAEAERVEAERLAAEKAEAERIEAERLAEEKAAAEKAEAERIAAEEAEAKRVEAERLEAELAAAMGRIGEERLAAERAESERLISESLAGDETIEKTEPSPESAFDFNAIETHESGDASPDSTDATNLPYFDAAITASLSDSSFGRAIEDFTGDVSGVLVEPPADHPADDAADHHTPEITSDLHPVEPAPLDSLSLDSSPADSAALEIVPLDSSALDSSALDSSPREPSASEPVLAEPSLVDSFLPELSLPESIDAVLADAPATNDAEADFFDDLVSPDVAEESAPEQLASGDAFVPELEQPIDQPPVAEHPVGDFRDSHDAVTEQTGVDGNAAFIEPIEEMESSIAPASELDLSKLVEQENQSAAQTEFESAPADDDWEPLPGGEVVEARTSGAPASESPSPAPRSSPIKPLFPMAEISVGGAFAPWGGNQENYLGGKPLKLPPVPHVPAALQIPKSVPAKVAPPKIEQPAARVEQPKPPVSPVLISEEDEHIDSVSAMIDEILIGEAKPGAQTKTPPFSQVSAPPMGATPQQFRAAPAPMPTRPAPVPSPAKPGIGRVGPDSEEPTAPPISATPATRRPLRRGLADMVEQQQKAAARIDEQIPPFGTPLPDALASRRKSEEPEPLESLAHPPVQETDVFAHKSPSAEEDSSVDDELPIVEDPLAPTGRGTLAGAVTPMDMVFDETNGSRNLSRRVRGGTRFPPAAASSAAIGAGATAGIGAAIGRVSLPNDPFWSGSPQPTVGNSGVNAGGSNGNGGMDLPPIAAMADALPPRGRHAVRPSGASATAFRPSKQVASRLPDFAYANAEDHSEALTRRKRLHRLVPVLMLVGLGLIAGDLAAIWKLMPPKSIVDARITFEHLANKSELDRHTFINAQNDKLKSALTRRLAIEALSKQNPEIAPGFLDNETEYGQVADSAVWPDQSRNVMQISRVGTDADGDIPRVKAMAIALHDGNSMLIDEAQRNQNNLDEAQSLIDQDRKMEDELQKQCDEARAVADGRPSVAQMNQLQADQDALEKAWKASVVARDTAEADLQRLQASQGQTGDGASASPDAAVVPMASDDQTRQMQSQLDAIKAQMDAAKSARIKQAQEARAALDASLAQFEQQVSDAKALSKDNPELTAYISAAQKFQETTRGLVDDLMRRQQQQYGQLTELQGRLSDKMDARRQEMWQKDETLQKMNDQLEYAKRQLNAALGTGQQKEAADLKAEVELLESTIKAREDLIPADPFYTDAIDQLQKIIDQQQKAMQEDRQTTAKALDDAQAAFAQSQPAVDKLPAEQKSLASEMEKRLADINAARAKYSDAANAVGDGSDDATKKLADQAASLTASIDAHRKQLANATLKNEEGASQAKRLKDIEDKKAEIVTLTKAAKDAEDAYTGKENDLQAAQAALAKARQAGDQLQDLNDQRRKIDGQMQQLLDDIKFKQDAVNTSVEPLMITDADIHRHAGADNRLYYAGITGTPIVLVFMGLILWAMHAASRELPLNALSPSDDDGPEPFALPALEHASENGSNGETNGHGSEEVLNSLSGSVQAGEDGEEQDDLQIAADLQLDADSELDTHEKNGTGPQTDQQPADAVANN